ncbi:MAG TPA: GIY-YIG nuclease family protein, partial [Nitrospirota bacterium]|nr:GIY-YIG nuclease family protein [Nitrospirota bacterium]
EESGAFNEKNILMASVISFCVTGKQMKQYYVYIMTNQSRTPYIGVTNNLERRVYEHKHHLVEGFTSRYKIDVLVYYEVTSDVKAGIAREKQIKGWLRSKKDCID